VRQFNAVGLLANEQEETILYRNMQSDLVQQMLRRLAALKLVDNYSSPVPARTRRCCFCPLLPALVLQRRVK
jgi:LPS-assembly lipoprotein